MLSRVHWSHHHMAPTIRARYVAACYLTPTTQEHHLHHWGATCSPAMAVAQDHRMSLDTRCNMATTLPRLWTWAVSQQDGRAHRTVTQYELP